MTDDPEYWEPRYAPLVEVLDGCYNSCIKVTFDTYEWTEDHGISKYKITVCTGERGTNCPKQHAKIVDCVDVSY